MEIVLTYMWVHEFTNTLIIGQTKCSSETIVDFKNYCGDVCLRYMIQCEYTAIGGIGFTVEVDESMFFKLKHHRGAAKSNQCWVLGGICRETGEAFMVVVPNRKADTLIFFLKKYVKPHTVIITDCWAGYKDLVRECNFAEHLRVNHSIEFVNSDDSNIHTNTVEGMWKHAKRSLPITGTNYHMIGGYLAEFCYRKMFKSSSDDLFSCFSAISAICILAWLTWLNTTMLRM